ncbi:hypothetical protein L873DRAFT_1838708 [Choiromyces venosus 120613-1]|uniref:G-patch domain-containing protein n=1 Tax=Choiromyces venosus 120613-1 TaxID=1336337 RepID=A0A3N4J2L8_9PEZI|nr:hypothetical protein L873DRAFT_1838708 [Choiromyces venosus 120613-1]
MGLAAPRNRTKIPADPRNTHWATNTTNFGHRLLTAHGWIPGSTLGDTTSSYYASGHISEASSTGVKITLKGNNLGIGCKGGIKDDECTGLDIFQDLLGRLNGKEEEVEERVQKRKMELITGRYGMKFVRGEMYVSSDVDTLIENVRKAKEEKAEIAKETEREERRRKKKERKAAKASKVEQEDQAEESPASPPAQELSKMEKKEKKKDKKSESSTPAPTSSSSDSESKSKKRKRTDDDSKKSRRSKKDKKEKKDKKKRSKESSETETPPSASDTSTPTVLTGRHAIRHRYIAAKRSAVMDTKALNEIFMIKA